MLIYFLFFHKKLKVIFLNISLWAIYPISIYKLDKFTFSTFMHFNILSLLGKFNKIFSDLKSLIFLCTLWYCCMISLSHNIYLCIHITFEYAFSEI